MAAIKTTLLLVEDDALISEMTRYAFIDAGFDVIAVASGDEALGLAVADVEFDMMFTDVDLDGTISGWELADTMHQMRPHLPIVATSGSASRDDIAANARIATFVSKPYRTGDVIAMAERMIEEARLAQPVVFASVPVRRLSA